jgi:hypothetical protein
MEAYRHPAAMEPLPPKERGARLSELTCEILKSSGRLTGQVHSPHVLKRVADLVREMNCYYSNRIEDHKTTPATSCGRCSGTSRTMRPSATTSSSVWRTLLWSN